MSSKKKAPAGVTRKTEKPAAPIRSPEKKVIAAEAARPAVRAAAPAAAAALLRTSEPQPTKRVAAEEPTEQLAEAFAGMPTSFASAGLGMLAVNGTILEMMRRNVSSGLDLARKLARAETPLQSMQLQLAYWREQSSVLAAQARELRELSSGLVSGTGMR
jgi:hypothetical protein